MISANATSVLETFTTIGQIFLLGGLSLILIVSIALMIRGRLGFESRSTEIGIGLFALIVIMAFVLLPDQYSRAFGAAGTLLVAIAAFISIEESRTQRKLEGARAKGERQRLALERIRNWAELTVHALATPSPESEIVEVNVLESRRMTELARLQQSSVLASGILWDGDRIGGEICTTVNDAIFILQKYMAIMMGEAEIKKFKDRYEIDEVITALSTWDESEPIRKNFFNNLSKVIEQVTKELVPE